MDHIACSHRINILDSKVVRNGPDQFFPTADIKDDSRCHIDYLVGISLEIPTEKGDVDGVHHIVEVAFAANIKTDVEVLAQGGSIATYATNVFTPEIPFWQLVFSNARVLFIGSDDVPTEAKIEATRAINQALEAG